MEVQINLDAPFTYHAGDKVPPFKFRGDIILATDPGKTNMAITLGNTQGTVLNILQFRAPGFANDNSTYCHDVKVFLTEYLKDCHVVVFGIEEAISKKGMNHHHSSMVLTEIRANLIDLAFQMTGEKALEINNWSWKYAILPDGMRSPQVKGSATFLRSVYDKYGNADVTDSICIFKYIIAKVYALAPAIIVTGKEVPLAPMTIQIVPVGTYLSKHPRIVHYEPSLTIEENAAFFINRTFELGTATVHINDITVEQIHKYAKRWLPTNCNTERVEVAFLRSG